METSQLPSVNRVGIGIDPGWKSLGWGVTLNGVLMGSGHMVPEESGSIAKAIDALNLNTKSTMEKFPSEVFELGRFQVDFNIERFVAYQGITTSASEDILMFIGALVYSIEKPGLPAIQAHMYRAIDWKPKICKYLIRTKGFSNPSSSFDKKFSLAAAEALSGSKIKSDHEADAVCLAYLTEAETYEQKRKEGKKAAT